MKIKRAVVTVAVLTLSAGLLGGCSERPASESGEALLESMAQSALSQTDGEVRLAGLAEPVEIIRDTWGVAHIYAETVEDLFFAQGFVAAQDRLWQMEWWRRFGEGRLAEILGPAALAHDRFARLLRYRGNMQTEWTSYHPDGERIITAFTRGVNAYVAQLGDNLPLEFQLTGIEPEPWSPDVPILRMAGLAMTGNNLEELDLALLVQQFGAEEANRRDAPDPWDLLRVPEALGDWFVPEDFRARVIGPRLPVPALLPQFDPLREVAASLLQGGGVPTGAPWGPGARAAFAAVQPSSRPNITTRALGEGSNNWVVDGSLSATGKPLLANDPHRSIALPSLRYLVHLVAPGWNVIGSGEPALPGVAIGHNERIGWGLTIVGIDQGDIYIERLNPDDPNQVWHQGAWKDLEVITEIVNVHGEEPRLLELKFNHHGPIVWEDPERGVAWAFRTVLTEPGTAGYLGSLRVDQANNWEEYLEALRAWKVPSENMIYGDVDGNIGWLAAGIAPEREGWNGRLPVPGSGEFHWQGFRDTLELPHESNPERGYIATANHNIMPPGYEPPLGYDWASPARFERLDEVLSKGGPFTLEDFQGLQTEIYSARAAARIAELAEVRFEDAAAERGRQLIAEWDAVFTTDSAAAALYKDWDEAVERQGEAEAVAMSVAEPGATTRPAEASSAATVTDPAEAAMLDAIATLEGRQGADWSAWRWGRDNRMQMSHPLGIEALGLGTVERPGDGTTVNVGWRSSGASFREILDFADWDRSVATSTPGQSGQPGSPHYDDLLPLWQRQEYFPLVYSREAVEANAAHRLMLRPAPSEVQ